MVYRRWQDALLELSGLEDWRSVTRAIIQFSSSYEGVCPHKNTILKWKLNRTCSIRNASKDFVKDFARSFLNDTHKPQKERQALIDEIDRLVGDRFTNSVEGSSGRSRMKLVLETDTTPKAIKRLSAENSFAGVYRTTRFKFGTSEKESPVAVELLEVEERHRDLQFRHHFRRPNGTLGQFKGQVRIFGKMLVLQGTYVYKDDHNIERHRLRAQKLRDEGDASTSRHRVRWGLMSSDVPENDSGEPAAARVLYEKLPKGVKIDAENQVFFADEKYLEKTYGGQLDERESLAWIVHHLISNNTSMASAEIDQTNPRGKKSIDMVLKLSLNTINNVTERLAQKMDDEFRENFEPTSPS